MDPKGKVAIVTGASKGIGLAVAIELARAGAKLLLVARGEPALAEAAQACRDLGATKVVTLCADVAKYQDLDKIVMTAVREFDGFDILVNNAGIGATKPMEQVSDEEYDHTMAINLRAPFMLTQAAIKTMRRRKGGQVVQIASGLAYFGRAEWSLYAACKFGLRGFTECVRHEVAKEGIKVGIVAPGYTETEFFSDWPDADTRSFNGALQPRDVAHAVMSMITQPATSDIKEITVRGPVSP